MEKTYLFEKELRNFLDDYFKDRFKSYFKEVKNDYPIFFKKISFKTFKELMTDLFSNEMINNKEYYKMFNDNYKLINEDDLISEITLCEIYDLNEQLNDFDTDHLIKIFYSFDDYINEKTNDTITFFSKDEFFHYDVEYGYLFKSETILKDLKYESYGGYYYLNLSFEDIPDFYDYEDTESFFNDLVLYFDDLPNYYFLIPLFFKNPNIFHNFLNRFNNYKQYYKKYESLKKETLNKIKKHFKDLNNKSKSKIHKNKLDILLLKQHLNELKNDNPLIKVIKRQIKTLKTQNKEYKEQILRLKNIIKEKC